MREEVQRMTKENKAPSLGEQVKEDLKRYGQKEVVFEHADSAEVMQAAHRVMKRHEKTIKELADR
jgi:hypothetical protein